MDILQQMARLILENPAITVEEIAKRLGYAEERSIYYWLEKGRFKGIKAFKKAVLTGTFPLREERPGWGEKTAFREEEREEEKARPPVFYVPIMETFTPHGQPDPASVKGYLPLLQKITPDAFGLKISDRAHFPLFQPGDVVVIEPHARKENGTLLATWSAQKGLGFFYFYHGRPPLLVNTTDAGKVAHLEGDLLLLGKVVYLVRSW